MLQNEKIKNNKNVFLKLHEKINKSLPDEINIYNEAFLINCIPLTPCHTKRGKTDHEHVKFFKFSGDINGEVICYIDTYNKTVTNERSLLSIFQESFNILIGKTLTNLMSDYSIYSTVHAPKDMTTIETGLNEKLSTGYKFIHNFQEFNCTVIFQIYNV